jgi:hypothetical protein
MNYPPGHPSNPRCPTCGTNTAALNAERAKAERLAEALRKIKSLDLGRHPNGQAITSAEVAKSALAEWEGK